MKSVFVSHSTHDRAFVESELIPFLESLGVQPWYSKHAITTASEWERSIRAALGKCDWILVVLSPESVRSDWVRAEVHWALEHKPGRVIPVLLSACDPAELHIKLAGIQFSDFHADRSAALSSIAALLELPAPPVRKRSILARRARWIAALVVFAAVATLAMLVGPALREQWYPPVMPARSDRDGVVDRVNVKPGDQVQKGQVLASLRRKYSDKDLEELKKTVDVCRNDALTKSNGLKRELDELARHLDLWKAGSGLVSEQELDIAKKSHKDAEESLAKAKLAVQKAQELYSDAQWHVSHGDVICPWDGEVAEIRRPAGDVVRDGETILIIRSK